MCVLHLAGAAAVQAAVIGSGSLEVTVCAMPEDSMLGRAGPDFCMLWFNCTLHIP